MASLKPGQSGAGGMNVEQQAKSVQERKGKLSHGQERKLAPLENLLHCHKTLGMHENKYF